MSSFPSPAPRSASVSISKASLQDSVERHSTSQTSGGSVLHTITQRLADSGVDVPAELYNEALQLAKDGHYGQARARLQVLIGLRPSDGEAHLLLGKIHVAGQQWRAALAAFDEAAVCDAVVPAALREQVVQNLQGEVAAHDDESTRALREAAEVKKLRSDVRRLRSENVQLAQTNRHLERETARWTWAATGSAGFAIVLMAAQMFLGLGERTPADDEVTAEVAARATAVTTDAAPVAAAPAEPTAAAEPAAEIVPADPLTPSAQNASLADAVKAALAGAGHPGVSVVVRGARASLSGDVPTHADLKKVLAAVQAVPGVEEVLADGLENTARRKGATHKVAGGESLSIIAYNYYGDQSLTGKILEANPSLGGKPNLRIDQELAIPPVPAKK